MLSLSRGWLGLAPWLLFACTESTPAQHHGPAAEVSLPKTPFLGHDVAVPESAVGSVMIHRTACYGECPKEWAFLHTDGTVLYRGESDVPFVGMRTGRVDPEDVRALLGLAVTNGYFDAKQRYSPGITDHATVFTAVALDGDSQVVRNYARGAPAAVAAVETTIDALLSRVKWDPESSSQSPASPQACAEMREEVFARCEDYLGFTGGPGTCAFWIEVSGRIPGWPDEDARLRTCDRMTKGLRVAPYKPTGPRLALPRRLRPSCRAVVEGPIARCRNTLLGGEPAGSCDGIDRAVDAVRDSVAPGTSRSLADFFCNEARTWNPQRRLEE